MFSVVHAAKDGDPMFPHFCPLNQNVAHLRTRGGYSNTIVLGLLIYRLSG